VPEHVEQPRSAPQDIYARALLEMADAAGQLDAVGEEVRAIGDLLQGNPDLLKLMSSRVLSNEKRAASIERVFKNQISDLVYRFLRVVNDKDRMSLLPEIVAAFAEQLDARRGVRKLTVFVASEMDRQAVDALARSIGGAIGGTVVLNQVVQPTLIGGLKLRMADSLVDGSVATQLKILERKMVASGRAKAREIAARD
jgi:F-type H+-transporting ATPase subunit delta